MPVAVITGAAQGIGYAIALQLAKDGFDISVHGTRNNPRRFDPLQKEIEGLGKGFSITLGDISIESDVVALIDRTVKELGSVNVMIANAGYFKSAPILETSAEDVDTHHAINLRGAFLCFKLAAKQMISQNSGGVILCAGSVLGATALSAHGAYTCSKHAIEGLTKSAALEFGRYGIRVNNFSPGVIQTPMLKLASEQQGRMHGITSEGAMALYATKTLLGRIGTPEDVAGLVSWLCSEKASYVTGKSFGVDGGFLLT
ncbi:putative oxidoreductase YohF [Neolecta irregularis DAH-3]|uniref:Putative oxidoreductase YohF n=1 Tax=Neolecta irregularis (strain DAH-3) TaxID=1198029 RepID=A0A1U7LH30_NEOID|nr:putative oxidoreductase YohF [Neolecta irregularis DAH-3]|eukprot:OLL21903.1 putative oxidoreductase YohF [Neolecta irregularis DAH-3]